MMMKTLVNILLCAVQSIDLHIDTYRENNEEYVNLYAETSDIYYLYNNEWVSM